MQTDINYCVGYASILRHFQQYSKTSTVTTQTKHDQGLSEEQRFVLQTNQNQLSFFKADTTTPQPFYGPFSETTRVSQCQNRTSGLYGPRED